MTQKISEKYSFMRLAKLIYPDVGYDSAVRRFQFVWRVISRYPYFNKIHQRLLDSVFEKVTLRHPRLLEKAFRPHVCSEFSIRERATVIVDHFNFLEKTFSDELIDAIYTESGKEIFSFSNEEYKILLHYLDQFESEGNLLLSLVDKTNQRIYTIAFSIIQINRRTSVVIGSIQGPAEQNILGKEIIKKLTHQCFGLRPKALMLELVRLFAIAIDCEQLLAVTNKSHVYQARKKRYQRIKCSYDALWSEYSAGEFNEKFVCLPLDNTHKPLEIIKSKKRAMYRRRYQLLEELKHAILLLHRYKRAQ